MTWGSGIAAALLLAGLGYVVWWDTTQVSISFTSAILAAQLPAAAAMALIALRTAFLSDWRIPLGAALRGHALALVGTLLLPARLSELGKPLHFRAIAGYPVPLGMVLVVEERIWDVVGLGLIAVLALALAAERDESAALIKVAWLLGALSVAGLGLLLLMPRIVQRLPMLGRLEAQNGIFRSRGSASLAWQLSLTVLIWTMSAAIMVVAYRFSGLPALGIEQLLVLFVASTLGMVMAIAPGSLGTFEASIVGVLVLNGVDWDAALAFAIGYRLCWMVQPMLVALATLRIDGPALTQAIRDWRRGGQQDSAAIDETQR